MTTIRQTILETDWKDEKTVIRIAVGLWDKIDRPKLSSICRVVDSLVRDGYLRKKKVCRGIVRYSKR